MRWARPRVAVSACLELEACRYNGQAARARIVERLAAHAELVPVCPEMAIGLGVPRAPVRLVARGRETRLVQPATGRDVTADMAAFTTAWLGGVGEVDGILLKSRSPSCGPKDVKVYAEDGIPRGEREPGVFAAGVASRYPLVAVEEEGRLMNQRLRHHFLTRLFQGARLRAVPATLRALVEFHTSSKLLLLAHSERRLRELGVLVANPSGSSPEAVKARYVEGFAQALAEPAPPGGVVNVLQHAAGHFSKVLAPTEKRLFLEMLSELRSGTGTEEAPRSLIRGWLARHDTTWLAGQTFFEPYPRELRDAADSGAMEAA